jgi:hypothetical protein
MISAQQILDYISQNGPSLVTDLTTYSRQNSMIIGAMLSSLIADKKLQYTYAKWGGSPLYYLPGQTELIQKIYPQLNEKDRKAYDLLKEKRVLADADQTPLVRACLRQLKDFAIPLTIQTKFGEEMYWKWYLTPNEEITPLVRAILLARSPQQSTQQNISQGESQPQEASSNPLPQPRAVEEKTESQQSQPSQKVSTDVQMESSSSQANFAKSQKSQSDEDSIFDSPAITQQTIGNLPDDGLLAEISQKLSKKQVTVLSCTVVKKNSELDLILKIPTALGFATYYAKAKKKKKSNDADLSQTFVKAQMLHLPGVYISYGDLTKKAEEMRKKDFAGLLVLTL